MCKSQVMNNFHICLKLYWNSAATNLQSRTICDALHLVRITRTFTFLPWHTNLKLCESVKSRTSRHLKFWNFCLNHKYLFWGFVIKINLMQKVETDINLKTFLSHMFWDVCARQGVHTLHLVVVIYWLHLKYTLNIAHSR
jgi:hypothetical protein